MGRINEAVTREAIMASGSVMTIDHRDMIRAIVQTETWFPKTFADAEVRDWGVMFITPTIPESNDGNHACVLRHHDDFGEVADEIATFYDQRGLSPRVNYLSADGDDPALRTALEATGFSVGGGDDMRVYLYEGPSRITPSPVVHVRRFDRFEDGLFEALAGINCERVAKVIERRMVRSYGWLFLGKIDGTPVSVALVEKIDGVCRVDEVHTAEAYRGRGAARAVIHALVGFYRDNLTEPLYLWTDSPIAERLYREAGFAKLDCHLTHWIAKRELYSGVCGPGPKVPDSWPGLVS